MIYTPENTSLAGKPVKVFVGGVLIDGAVYADTDKGIVWFAPKPVRATWRGDEIYHRKLKGNVTVEPL